MTVRVALSDALLNTLAAPATWPIALATFLLRGGVVLVALPIVVVPSPVGIGNALLPTLIELTFQGVSVGLGVAIAIALLAFVVWVVGGGLLAARLETEAVRIVRAHEVLEGLQADGSGTPSSAAGALSGADVAGRVLAARLISHLPTAVAVALGSARLVEVAYRELTSPLDVETPIAWRVLRGAPEVVVAIVACWTLGEICGALAARRFAAGERDVWRAVGAAAVSMGRHPATVLSAFGAPIIGLLVVAIPAGLAAAAGWTVVRAAVQDPNGALWATLAVVLLVALWLVGLGLIAVICAWRAAVWTLVDPQLRRKSTGSRVTEAG